MPKPPSSYPHRRLSLILALLILLCVSCSRKRETTQQPVQSATPPVAAASSACRECHPVFYKKWATSHHGLAMQPFSPQFASSALVAQREALRVGGNAYQVFLDPSSSYMEERGPAGIRKLPMVHVMGGKNVYYFLTPLDRGRLQVLPLAYDVQKKAWYDMAASGVRMHVDRPTEAPLPWTDPAFTFNTSCFSCHVSQLKMNYDLATDTYDSRWSEPGISCESCHGDGQAHIELYKNNKGEKVTDMRILRTTKFTVEQRNEMCAPCHAKMSPISPSYQVTQRFFDHYDLVTLEDADYYPDGRDLGENYTYTSWLMSPCLRSGKFDCIHCHTSSGRYKFATENPNGACLPCHQERVANVEAHAHHKAGSPGSRCIDCHMPKTRFANMNRSDHSLLPPTPAVTVKFNSPNACNLCHKDKDAAWADAKVRQWHRNDYQRPVLERAELIDAARRRDWKRLPAMLAYIQRPGGDHVTQASLIRLLRACDDLRKLPVLTAALRHRDPLLRAAAASSLAGTASVETRDALARATTDEYRLVRIRAAASLAGVRPETVPAGHQEAVRKATAELIASYNARPDDFSNHTNLGNFHMDRGELDQAIPAFETAIRLRPDSVGTLVNASIAYSRAGRLTDAERVLSQALRFAPENAPANFNRGLLLAELGRKPEAEASLRKALASDPNLAAAAFNLCVLMMGRKEAAGLDYCRQAVRLDPASDKYVSSLGFFLDRSGQSAAAIELLEAFCSRHGGILDTRMLLADLYLKSGRSSEALKIYRTAAAERNLPENQRRFLEGRLRALQSRP